MTIRDLLDLPDQVRKGDFVLSLARGIDQPEETVRTYALTPNLVHAFRRSLGVIDGALRGQRSQAAYLHGSFGAGKSHFMAMLDLMLGGHTAPWERSELHPLRQEFGWIESSRFLQLPLHMIGAESMEQKVFEAYVEWVQAHHPEAPLPALYSDQDLFENACSLRADLGDERFFGKLNQGTLAEAAGWGDLAKEAHWEGPRFERAVQSVDRAEREELFSALVKSHFPAFLSQLSRFVDLDSGLGVLSRHAATLGYQAVILYLDELILWLAGHFANLSFVQTEAQKIAKLKEAQDERRDIPVVSFIARQRDLTELVGEDAAGSERTTLRDSINWHSGRLETIVLEDRNLPAIVERRVVRPRSDRARETLADGFVKMRRRIGDEAWGVLLGSAGELTDFQKVYPFSPALVETLVALSDCLQRERTAIRLLMELLIEHLPDLEPGDVVPLGDIFDVIAGGEDAFDQVMRDRFDRAKHLYRNHLLPLIHGEHQTGTRDKCQRLRDDHPARHGCSRCPMTACRNDNRLAKTLLLAALVPEAAPFKDLSVKRLVRLNPGTVATPIPGTEEHLAAEKIRRWATQVGQLRVGEQADPQVSLRLEGVDLTPILASAQEADSHGARKRLLQRLLFEALDLPSDATLVEKTVVWRGTKRTGSVRFGNVRELPDGALACPAGSEWYLVIDYPFDEAGRSPEDDLHRVEKYREAHGGDGNLTFVWLPTFFTDKLERELGQLAVLDHLLTADTWRKYLGHLRTEDQARARMDLDSLRNQKQAQIRRALAQAYGIAIERTDEGLLDRSRRVEEHLVSLQAGLEGRPVLAADFRDALEQLATRLLEHRYPHHPKYGGNVTVGKLEKVQAFLEKLLEAPEQRLGTAPPERKELAELGGPLGLVQLGETSAVFNPARLRAAEQQRQRAGIETPTVEQARVFVDPDATMGLVRENADLMVVMYAHWSGRAIERGGQALESIKLGKLPDDAELVKPDLPTETEWRAALELAGHCFGIAQPGRALTVRNLTSFGASLNETSAAASRAAGLLPDAIGSRVQRWLPTEANPPRLQSARAAAELASQLKLARPAAQVRVLASFEARTSPQALGRSLATADTVLRVLQQEAIWLTFESVAGLTADPSRQNRAMAIIEELAAALRDDQLNTRLEEKVDALIRQAKELIQTRSEWEEVAAEEVEVTDPKEYRVTLERLAERLARKAAGVKGGEIQLKVKATVLRRGGGK
jgi:hypothetical protein